MAISILYREESAGMSPTLRTNNGIEMPQAGFGVYQIPASRTTELVRVALDAGYRHIDTAQAYGNEAEIGTAVAESGLPREDVFITTKLNPQRHGHTSTSQELEESLRKLRTSYVDLYLLHWPAPGKDRYLESWRACEDLLAEGKVRAIGVSNLTGADLAWLAERSQTTPAVNQVELHPSFQQRQLRQYHQSRGIITQAWGPLAWGESLKDPVLKALAQKYGKTTAQLVLRWHIQLGNVPLCKSARPARIRENIEIFDFHIDTDDMDRIAALENDPHGAPVRTTAANLPRWQP